VLITAAISDRPEAPFALEQIALDEPRADEVLVRVVACGICHTDNLARMGEMPVTFPAVFGHEGAGIVEAVGPGVRNLAAGDHVVLGPPWCGRCRNCLSGQQKYCQEIVALCFAGAYADGTTSLHRSDGPVHGHFFQQSSFATYALATERNAVRVDPDVSLQVAAALGCGVATGAGSVLNALRPPVGSSVAVFGAGAVGLSAVMAAAVAGCTPIVAIDVRPSRLELARTLGATHVLNASADDIVAGLREIGGGTIDATIECSGDLDALRHAVEILPLLGTCLMVGAAAAGQQLTLDHRDLLFGKRVHGILGGEGRADTFLPALLDLHARGRFPFDRLVTHFAFEQIEAAVAAMHNGSVIKPVLHMSQA
jgi:aryl-alcohol dehydrogenase